MKNKMRLLFLWLLAPYLASVSHAAEQSRDLTEIPFETLLQTEVLTASHMVRQVSDSPSAVAIVTAEDIRAYGYRTLADVINSMRGLYTTYDRKYEYMGGRGFGGAEDYTGRVMLLIDGYATQDNIYNQAYIDNSGPIDLELVERVEYVPGTGSVIYGNNALLGIINVVTKRGRDINGAQVSTEFASFHGRKQRATFGRQLDNGADVLLSVSRQSSEGQSHYFPGLDAAATNHGRSPRYMDAEDSSRIFAKIEYSGLTLSAGHTERTKYVPTRSVRGLLFPGRYYVQDQNSFVSLKYEADLSLQLKSLTHLYYGSYRDTSFRDFDPNYYVGDPEVMRRNANQGQWVGLDQKFVATWFPGHTLLFGAELRADIQQHILLKYLTADYAYSSSIEENHPRRIFSLYATDEYVINDFWRFNIGGRYDKATQYKGSFSPRLALIYSPSIHTTWKASFSEAFRLPNALEIYDYESLVKPERVKAFELNLQQQLTRHTRLTGSAYQYRMSDLVYYNEALDADLNTGKRQTRGVEVELEGNWPSGLRGRTSLALQRAEDEYGRWLLNSPKVLAKGQLSMPVVGVLRAGMELQYLGARLTETRRRESGTHYANLTFSSDKKWHGLSASFSIRNLFDKKYSVVAPFHRSIPSGGTEDTLRMDGRNYWLQVTLDF